MILDELKQLLADQFEMDPDEISEDTDFEEDLDADSLDMVEIAMACEDEFDVSIDDDRMSSILNTVQTVGDLARYLETIAER